MDGGSVMGYLQVMKRVALTLCLSPFFLLAEVASATVPPNFTDELVTSVGSPTAFAFTPDGRLLIARQPGVLRVFASGSLLPTAALTIPASSICTNSEQGLLGVAVDPAFASNNFIYLFYTFESPTCVNRISRFTLPPSNIIAPASELVLIDNMPSPAGNHNAGDVGFGKDGFLYATIGDGGCDYAGNSGCAGANDAARDRHVLTGKLLRITSAGGIPATNPFQGAGTARCNTGPTTLGNTCQEIYATGLRNPFRFAFDPNAATTRLFINDVGQGLWEEVDEAQSGADYGWNLCEGNHPNNSAAVGCGASAPSGHVPPIFDYRHGVQVPGTTSTTNCNSITGGAFVPNGVWPSAYDGAYLLSDFVCGWIFRINNGGSSWSAVDFATNLGGSSATHLRFGPYQSTQALYYATFASGGQIRRVRYAIAGNNTPTAVGVANPLSGVAPLNVTFDATGSSDLDAGDTLTYFWDFGDGTPEASTTSLTIGHNYLANGAYTARLRARDQNFAFSTPVDIQIQVGNTAPTATITSPATTDTFRVGQSVTLIGSATDPEQGALPPSALSWTVLLHHDVHTHPFFGPAAGNNVVFTTPAPEDLAAAANSFLEVHLTATDSGGLTGSANLDFQPLKIPLDLSTTPPGLSVAVNGGSFVTPVQVTSWADWTLQVATGPQTSAGTLYEFDSWSDAGAMAHNYVTPQTPAALSASFDPWPGPGGTSYHTLTPCRAVDTRNAPGPLGGPALSSGTARRFVIAGTCGVPASARALAVNLTVVSPSGSGFLRAVPAGFANASTSALNFQGGQTRASLMALGTANGALDATVGITGGGSAHLIVDVSGYFD